MPIIVPDEEERKSSLNSVWCFITISLIILSLLFGGVFLDWRKRRKLAKRVGDPV